MGLLSGGEEDISCTDLYYPEGLWRLLLYTKKHYSGHSGGTNFFFGLPLPHTFSSVQARSIEALTMRYPCMNDELHSQFVQCGHTDNIVCYSVCLLQIGPGSCLLSGQASTKLFPHLLMGDSLNYRLQQERRLPKQPL